MDRFFRDVTQIQTNIFIDACRRNNVQVLTPTMVYERITAIKHRLQRILADYEPIRPRTWQERLADGEVEPYLAVVEHYKDKPLALKALYTLTTDAHVRKVAKDEKERKMITYYRPTSYDSANRTRRVKYQYTHCTLLFEMNLPQEGQLNYEKNEHPEIQTTAF